MGVKNSRIAWKRNGFYGRIINQITQLTKLKTYPLTSSEQSKLRLAISFLQSIEEAFEIRKKFLEEIEKI